MHKFVMFGALALVAAMLYNVASPKIYGSSFGAKLVAGTTPTRVYAGRTAITGIAFFAVLAVASILMGLVTKKSPIQNIA